MSRSPEAVWMPDGTHLVSASRKGRLVLWNVASGEADIKESEHQRILAVAVTPDGRRVVCGGTGGTLKVRDLMSDDNICSFADQINIDDSIFDRTDAGWECGHLRFRQRHRDLGSQLGRVSVPTRTEGIRGRCRSGQQAGRLRRLRCRKEF